MAVPMPDQGMVITASLPKPKRPARNWPPASKTDLTPSRMAVPISAQGMFETAVFASSNFADSQAPPAVRKETAPSWMAWPTPFQSTVERFSFAVWNMPESHSPKVPRPAWMLSRAEEAMPAQSNSPNFAFAASQAAEMPSPSMSLPRKVPRPSTAFVKAPERVLTAPCTVLITPSAVCQAPSPKSFVKAVLKASMGVPPASSVWKKRETASFRLPRKAWKRSLLLAARAKPPARRVSGQFTPASAVLITGSRSFSGPSAEKTPAAPKTIFFMGSGRPLNFASRSVAPWVTARSAGVSALARESCISSKPDFRTFRSPARLSFRMSAIFLADPALPSSSSLYPAILSMPSFSSRFTPLMESAVKIFFRAAAFSASPMPSVAFSTSRMMSIMSR